MARRAEPECLKGALSLRKFQRHVVHPGTELIEQRGGVGDGLRDLGIDRHMTKIGTVGDFKRFEIICLRQGDFGKFRCGIPITRVTA